MPSQAAGPSPDGRIRRGRGTAARRALASLLGLCAAATALAASRPKEATLQLRFGVEMAQKGSWKEAEFRFRRAAEIAPGDAEILNNLAVAYENNGRYDDAERTYLEALGADAGNERIRSNYERFRVFYEDLKQKRDAEQRTAGGGDGRPAGGAGGGP
jgi:Flp pilus assembly protein TadD